MSSPQSAPPAGFRDFIRRVSTSGGARPSVVGNSSHEADIERLVEMGFPRVLAQRQLEMSHGDPKRAAEYLVHAAHPKGSGADTWNHPDCPVCVRETENVRIAEGRRPSIAGMLERVRSRGQASDDGEDHAPAARRGSVGAMLRRPSISAALQRMTTRDLK